MPQSGTTYTSISTTYLTFGLPNQSATYLTENSDYWRSLRQPSWTSPALTATYSAPDINLSWNAATDPYPADNNQGYMILRSTVNTFTAPNDGRTYVPGEMIGTGTVIANITPSTTTIYTDTYTLNCGDTVYYQVYAYRFGTDDMNGNNYNMARGRAYNETSFGAAFAGIPDAPAITSVTHTDAYCGQNNGSITITATGVPGVTLEYSINGTDWFIWNVFTYLPPGIYTVYVRIAGFTQCQVEYSEPVVIDDFAAPLITQVDHTDASCGNNNGSITITASGGTPPLQYSIDNGANWFPTNIFSGLVPGSYDVKIKDANNCEVPYATPVVIEMIPSPVAPTSATVDRNNLCSDDTGDIVLTANDGSGLALEWFSGSCGGTPVGTGTPLTLPSPTVTTTYYCYWTSTICGNSACASVTVDVTDPPTVSDAGDDQSLCGVFATTLAGNQPVSGTGLWTQVIGPAASVFADNTLFNTQVTVTVYGSYTYRWTISTGPDCPASPDDVNVSYGDAVIVTAGSNSPVCEGNTIFLTSSISGATYAWTGPNGFVSDLQNPSISNATLTNEGTYTVTVSNIPGGCPNSTDDTDVDIVELPVAPASAASDPDTVCQGYSGTILLTATGGSGTTLEWYEGSCNGTLIGTGNVLLINAPAVTTTYYAAWSTDQCGNSSCASTIVTVSDPPSTADAGTDQSLCGVLTTTMAANDPDIGSGLWTEISGPGSVTFSDPTAFNSQITVTAQGDYILRWTISNGVICPSSFDEVSLNFGDAIQVVASSNSPVCTGLEINLFSSITGATYSWTGPNGFTSTLQNPVIANATLADAGTFTVQVTAIPGGCPDTQDQTDIIINQSAAEPASVTANLDIICAGITDDLVLTANGGSGVDLEWFTGSCGGTLIGTGATLTLPAPMITTTYYAGWSSPDCGNSPCKSVTITVEEPPSPAVAGSDQAICNELTTQLQANTPIVGTGQWSAVSGPGTVSFSDEFSPASFVIVSEMGVYMLRWTISGGTVCAPRTDDISVEFSDNVTVTVSSNSPFCEGEDLLLFSSITGATYSWTGPGGFTADVQNPVIPGATAGNSGDYSVTVSGIPGGCPTTTGSTTVIIGAMPAVPVVGALNISGSEQDVCSGATMHYSIIGPVPGSDYNWSVTGGGTLHPMGGADTDMNVEWTATDGSYELTVTETNDAGCTGDPFLLTVNITPTISPSITISAGNNPVCPGGAVQITAIVTDGGTAPVYRWIRNGAEVGTDSSVYILESPLQNDLITCEVTSNAVCASPSTVTSNTVEIEVYDPVAVSITYEEPLCAGSPNLLDAGNSFTAYLWNDGSTESSLTVTDEGIYWVQVTDVNGCTGTDSIAVEPCEASPVIYAPNAFTPGSDGKNDRFLLVCNNPEAISDYEISIYNRWGQLIYRSNDFGEGWDGTMNENPCQGDVYTFIATYSFTGSGTQQVTGIVTLVR